MVPHCRARSRAGASPAGGSADRGDLDGAAAGPIRAIAGASTRGIVSNNPGRVGCRGAYRASAPRMNHSPANVPEPAARGLLGADPVSDFDAGPPRVSFEFFPPKTPEMEVRL